MYKRIFLFLGLLPLLFLACKKDHNETTIPPDLTFPPTFPYIDTLSILTYNIAGLPEALSSSEPSKNTSEIGRRINNYSVVAVQEDFNYNHLLYGTDKHPYKTEWSGPVPLGDGLNVLSQYKISDLKRMKWKKCNGADCLTPKGFSFQRIEIADGISFDLYDVHTNARRKDNADNLARQNNMFELLAYIQDHSEGRPLIVLGDFNSLYTFTGDTLEILQQLGLQDTWLEFALNNILPEKSTVRLEDCTHPASATCETEDRIFYRSSDNVKFKLLNFDRPRDAFQRDGRNLSDHFPVYSLFEIKVLGK